jgi:hypothetical protein
MILYIVGGALMVTGIALYFLLRTKALEDYNLSDLKEGDIITIKYGYGDKRVTVFKNFPDKKLIKLRVYGQIQLFSYDDYNFRVFQTIK